MIHQLHSHCQQSVALLLHIWSTQTRKYSKLQRKMEHSFMPQRNLFLNLSSVLSAGHYADLPTLEGKSLLMQKRFFINHFFGWHTVSRTKIFYLPCSSTVIRRRSPSLKAVILPTCQLGPDKWWLLDQKRNMQSPLWCLWETMGPYFYFKQSTKGKLQHLSLLRMCHTTKMWLPPGSFSNLQKRRHIGPPRRRWGASSLISSILISNIQKSDLDYIQIIAHYGRLIVGLSTTPKSLEHGWELRIPLFSWTLS